MQCIIANDIASTNSGNFDAEGGEGNERTAADVLHLLMCFSVLRPTSDVCLTIIDVKTTSRQSLESFHYRIVYFKASSPVQVRL